MKIYIRSALKDKSILSTIEAVLKESGHKVQTSILKNANADEYSSKDTGNISKYDILFIEASIPNAQLGYETSFALEQNIPTVILYNNEIDNKGLFPLIALNQKTKLIIKGYKTINLEKDVKKIIHEMEDHINSRFTMNLTPQISEFLNWISDNEKITRSNYIRSLIEGVLKKSVAYKKYLKSLSKE